MNVFLLELLCHANQLIVVIKLVILARKRVWGICSERVLVHICIVDSCLQGDLSSSNVDAVSVKTSQTVGLLL